MIKIIDLKKEYSLYEKDVIQKIKDVCESQIFINGPEVINFEKTFANFCNTKYALGCSSGTDALILSLLALGIGCGDEVITTPFSFFSTAEAIIRVGATPVFVDIREDTFCIDEKLIERKITKKTKCILPVHIYGQSSNMTEICRIAKDHNLKIIEDCAQAHGAEWEGKRVGSFGDAGCFSFFPTKNLGAFGDAGIVTTNSKETYEKMILLRQHGIDLKNKYNSIHLGGNFRIDAIQAGVLSVKIKHINEFTNKRIENAEFYNKNIKPGFIMKPVRMNQARHVYHQYSVRTEKRDKLKDFLLKNKIESSVFYPYPIPFQTCFNDKYKSLSIPICENVCKSILSIPVYPGLGIDNVEKVTDVLNRFKG